MAQAERAAIAGGPRPVPQSTGVPAEARHLVLEIDAAADHAALEQVCGVARQCDIALALHEHTGARFLLGGLPDARRLLGRCPGVDPFDPRCWTVLPGVRRALFQAHDAVLAGRDWQPADTVVRVGGRAIGGARIAVIAGPCAVESREQIHAAASLVRDAGASWLRGGAFKPRTSPYSFQGLGEVGLALLREAADANGLGVVTEVTATDDVALVARYSDVLQVGSRNAQHFPLLRRLGEVERPVLLKRGFGCTLEELVHGAEYVISHGNPDVVLCERGIRSFESATRFTFDVNAIPWLARRVHLPLVADPSHATGDAGLVGAVARAAVAAGAHGVMLEVHPEPGQARSDGRQSLGPEQFEAVMREIAAVAAAVGRRV
ncbi:MAG: 3-deoxy-7-phosphoheptulonate synthase [Candidatus Eiseniibacteriota bacterium]